MTSIIVGVAVVAAVTVASSDRPSVSIAKSNSGAAPGFRLTSLRNPNMEIALEHFRGRPLVVNYFASWCAPCRQEMPALQAVYDDVKRDIAFLGIDNRDIRRDALALVRDTGVRYPIAFDPAGETARAFGVLGMPTTVFVAADGQLLGRVNGEITEAELRSTLRRIFDRGP